MANFTHSGDVDKFDWSELKNVRDIAKAKKWDTTMDSEIRHYLFKRGLDIRHLYLNPRLTGEGGFVRLNSWDRNLATILPALLGYQTPLPAATMCNSPDSLRQRSEGEKTGRSKADKARDILNNLLNYSSALSWTLVTKSDIRVMEKAFQSAGLHDASRIRERWNLLSQNGKRMEFPMMAFGWLLGVLERKNHEEHEPLELEDDDLEIGMEF
ncbi:hypothetical protein BDP27DRAFT_1425424 [Rhodocollybia butyracea]|uniref:Uncharacterized protein n=1 Tax=Rhodocollybia butyracea TaxID=206335 RepID=A0A9P5PMW9_9AGAR|nr:hypothetical protein BDP27DRAFT_1425424 [Rhodocollybia butyracea]